MASEYSLTWDLDPIFDGGSGSPALLLILDTLAKAPQQLREQVQLLALEDTPEALDQWHSTLQMRDRIEEQLDEVRAFVGCLMSQDVNDAEAKLLAGRVQQLIAAFEGAELQLKDRLRRFPEPAWQRLLADERFQPVAFQLQEARENAAELLSPEQEALIVDLSVDGYRAWERLYQTVVGRMTVPWVEGGLLEQLSVGQAYNRFAHPDPAVRARHFAHWTQSWEAESELCAAALNHIGGFRLAIYRHRGWDSVLARALKDNRISQATLEAMWGAVDTAKDRLVVYFQRKAKLLGLKALHWYDELAPIADSVRPLSYDEAAGFVVEQLRQFSPRMADFARLALENRWVEAEDRPAKRPGGYCTSLPLSRQSRVFMTFGGTSDGASTLAHELGHGYHNQVQWDLPTMARGFTLSTAETASTFAGLVVSRAAVAQAGSREEKLTLLDEALRDAATMFMNIPARFLFERRFYEARKQGPLSVDQLNEMMVQAQKDAFRNGLAGYHPQFWASKGHFYGSGTPFYNFPYTLGFLLSAGIYARALEGGAGFEESYVGLLRDTGRMTTEELAQRHLGVDLSKPDFWVSAVDLVMASLPEFLSLTEER
ncbi:MAG: M3 family oligoendopeptidase [Chloroflexi bacterium]|nr:M3 family oligoendopeptidase [Chloroflexota bacterium]